MLARLPLFKEFSQTFRLLTGQTPSYVELASEIEGLPPDFRDFDHPDLPAAPLAFPPSPILISQANLLQEYVVPIVVRKKPVGFLRSGFFLVSGNIPEREHPKDLPSHTPRCRPERFVAVGTLLSIMAEVIGVRLQEQGHDLGNGVPSPVKRAVSIIRQQSREPLTLGAVGREVGVSANYLTEMLTKHTGRSFRRHLTECRIEDAQNLLKATKLTIGEIAFAVGFQSLSQFNRSFRSLTGFSPSQFRKKHGSEKNGECPSDIFP